MNEAQVLAIQDEAGVRALSLKDFSGHDMTLAEFCHILAVLEAFWKHGGDPRMPHAELTSGRCSDGFVNCGIPLSYANLCMILAEQLARVLWQHWNEPVDWVVGSDHAAASLVAYLAYVLGARFDFCEKGPGGTQVWKRHVIPQHAKVVHAEELMTTARTTEEVRKGVREAHAYPVEFVPFLPVLVHRSDVGEVDNSVVVSPFHMEIKTWEPAECPLCQAGSQRVRPKTHWAQLAGRM